MTTIRQIIEDAYGEANIVALGDLPDAEQLEYALRRLNTLYMGFLGNELGEPLTDVNYGKAGLTNSYAIDSDYSSIIDSKYVPNNSQLILNLSSAHTLYLPPKPRDGARFGVIDNGNNLATYPVTISGNGREIEDASSITLNTNGLKRQWFYRGDLGNWVRLSELEADDVSPFPEEFDDFLTTLLAFRINPRFGAETNDNAIEVLKRMRRMFRARYRQVQEVSSELGLYKLPSSYQYFWYQSDFNNGKI